MDWCIVRRAKRLAKRAVHVCQLLAQGRTSPSRQAHAATAKLNNQLPEIWGSISATMPYTGGGWSDDVTCSNRPAVGLSAAALSACPPGLDCHPGPFPTARKAFCGPLVLGVNAVGKRLYVGNLSFSVTSQGLEELFAQFGAVKDAQVVQDRETGRSKGFGFVEMQDDNAAQEAIQGLNEKEFEGRNLTVNEARPREERSGGYGGGRGGGRGGRW